MTSLLCDRLEEIMRFVVRDELSRMLNSEPQNNTDKSLAIPATSRIARKAAIKVPRARKGVRLANKGKVTNPSTDRRLKANREAMA